MKPRLKRDQIWAANVKHESEAFNMSNDSKIDSIISRPVSRRSLIKGGAAAGVATAGLKASKLYAAPLLQSGPLEISYVTWFWNEPGRQDAWRDVIKKFHAEQNDIRIKEAGWPFNDFSNNIVTQLQAGKLDGDIIQTTPDLVLRLLKAGVLTPLDSVLKANNITTLNPAHKYIEDKNGAPLGLDVVTVPFGLFYNKSILDAAKITTLPTTTDEWFATAKQLTDRPNHFGMTSAHLVSEPASFWFTLQEWAAPFAGRWAQGKTPLLTSDPIINAVKLFKQFYDATFPQGTDDATQNSLWAGGQIAEQLIVSPVANVIKANNPTLYDSLRSMPLPWESKETVYRIHPITVNNTSKNQAAGIEFITWLYKPENYRKLLTECLDLLPSYDVGGLDDYYASIKWADGFKDLKGVTPPDMVGDFIFNNDEFGQIVITHVSDVLAGNASVEDALAAAQTEAEDLAGRLES
jgi:ABC-type glycerol-3-phosphate transport system substrate-binding protein